MNRRDFMRSAGTAGVAAAVAPAAKATTPANKMVPTLKKPLQVCPGSLNAERPSRVASVPPGGAPSRAAIMCVLSSSRSAEKPIQA